MMLTTAIQLLSLILIFRADLRAKYGTLKKKKLDFILLKVFSGGKFRFIFVYLKRNSKEAVLEVMGSYS